MTDFTHIQSRRDGPVEHLVLNRPHVRNAFNEELIAEVTSWAGRIGSDVNVRAVVISGAGKTFCAGADLAWMARMADYTPEDNVRDAHAGAAMYEALNTLPVPVIAQVHGAALGGGAGLAAVADVVVAEENTTFGFTEVRLGLIPAMIAPYVLAKIGPSHARELFVTGRRFTAHYAREIGLVHEVAGAAALETVVGNYLEEILANGREAMAAAKSLLRQISHRPPSEVMSITAEAIAARRVSREAQERLRAFLKK